VINIASVNGMGVFGHPAYSAAKAGLLHFTKLVAVEYGKFGIRSNAVAPGTVRTQAWEARAAANPNVFEEARRWYPLQRVVDPEDVANAVGFSRRSAGAGHHRRLPARRLRPDGRPGGACPHLFPILRLLNT
jgi:NAD(P)-dependent dehydrogenase (short-subunit alcohol dehydrogenase family)